MKKFTAMLLTGMIAISMLASCSSGGNTASSDSSSSKESKPASSESSKTSEAASDNGSTASGGSVYYLNFKPEADQAWQELAATYTEQTGVPVKVVTAAGGTYSDTLTAEMAKSEAPTLFQVGNKQGLADWNDYCLDLSGTDVYTQMTTDDFNLKDDDGAVKAIGYCYEAYGIIANKALLQEAGYTVEDITNFDSLKKVADDIHARSGELGFDAFTSAGLDGSSSWRYSGHLTSVALFYEFRDDNVTEQPATVTGKYLDNFRNIWDLYVNDSSADPATLSTSTGDMCEAEFGTGKAAFFQQGTWEYANLVDPEKYGMNPDDLVMLPIYCGVEGEENAALCCGTENCWAVNAKASEEDIQATLDFINWVVTSDEGTTMMADQFGPIPFKAAKEPENVFFADANRLLAEGKYTVGWAFTYTPNTDSWRAGIVTALAAYSADPSDANWENVKTAYVDGWAIEYAAQNG